MDGNKPKNKHVEELLKRQANKKQRKPAENPLIVPKGKQIDTEKNRSPEKSREELQAALKEERKSMQIPQSLHKKIKRLSVTDEVTMYEVLEKAVSLYEANRRR